MHRAAHLIALAAFLAGVTCLGVVAAGSPGGEGRGSTDDRLVLFYGGTFHTGFDGRREEAIKQRTADAVLVRNGRIIAVGTEAGISASEEGRRAERIDIMGAHAFPGFQDAHGHIEDYGAFLDEVDLKGCETYAEVIRRVRARASELPAGQWITGRGWDQSLWAGEAFPEHPQLTLAVPDHPVLVYRTDGHAALVNAMALTLSGLGGTDLPEAPPGGKILTLAGGGASGVLIGTAVDLVGRSVPAPSDETRMRRILRAQESLLALGLTCVHDMGVDRRGTELFSRMRDEGKLELRVVSYLRANDLEHESDFEGFPTAGDGRDLFSVVGVKFMLDGALGSRGAALIEDYSDAPGNKGLARMDLERFTRQVELTARAGLQPATHAIGDRANRLVLDVYERAASTVDGFKSLRPRIEHAQVIAPNDFARFEPLGVILSMQPTHATSDMRWVRDRLGEERAARAYAWRKVRESTPLPLAFGSDFPGERADPLEGLYAALTRQDRNGAPKGGFFPRQRVTANEALGAMTAGAAFAATQDDRRGLIAHGYGCDLTIVDEDLSQLTASTAKRALEAKVLLTVVNGEVVYSAR